MKNIKEKKRHLLQEFKSQLWPRSLKTWQLDNILVDLETEPIAGDEFKAGFSKIPSGIKIYSYEQAPEKLRTKFLKYYQAQNKLDKYLLATAKNYFIVNIKATADLVINWRNNLISSQVVFFLISGQGRVEIIEEQNSSRPWLGQAVITEIAPASQATHTLLVKKNKGLTHLYYRAFIKAAANFSWQMAVHNKASLTGSLVTTGQARGSQSYQLVAGKFTDSSQTNLLMINDHQGENNDGDMIFKGLGDDRTKACLAGIIRIGKKSKYSNSYLKEDIILLNERAKITAIPNLEILNNEVKASHGATVGKIDERAMFYLMSRGLNKVQARDLILAGFFKGIIGKIDNKGVREKFAKVLL